jgi:hypothetical protein
MSRGGSYRTGSRRATVRRARLWRPLASIRGGQSLANPAQKLRIGVHPDVRPGPTGPSRRPRYEPRIMLGRRREIMSRIPPGPQSTRRPEARTGPAHPPIVLLPKPRPGLPAMLAADPLPEPRPGPLTVVGARPLPEPRTGPLTVVGPHIWREARVGLRRSEVRTRTLAGTRPRSARRTETLTGPAQPCSGLVAKTWAGPRAIIAAGPVSEPRDGLLTVVGPRVLTEPCAGPLAIIRAGPVTGPWAGLLTVVGGGGRREARVALRRPEVGARIRPGPRYGRRTEAFAGPAQARIGLVAGALAEVPVEALTDCWRGAVAGCWRGAMTGLRHVMGIGAAGAGLVVVLVGTSPTRTPGPAFGRGLGHRRWRRRLRGPGGSGGWCKRRDRWRRSPSGRERRFDGRRGCSWCACRRCAPLRCAPLRCSPCRCAPLRSATGLCTRRRFG